MSKISSKEKIKIKIELKYVKNADHYKRLCTILAWDRGREVPEIADVLQIPQSTVYRYIKEYKDDTKGSNDQKGGSSSKLDLDQEKEMIDHLDHTTYLYVKDICQYIEKTYAIRYSQSGMKDYLKRHGFTYKKSKKFRVKMKYLPPYSPNLNAIERLWKFMREKKIYNRYYECRTSG